jgi:rod shape-determining protein MreD
MSVALPVLSTLIAVLATAVPFGLPADLTFILPFLMVLMVFAWAASPRTAVPLLLALSLGLLTDFVTAGPLGFWGLMTLIGASAGAKCKPIVAGRGMADFWLCSAGLVVALGIFGWLLASLYFFRWIDWRPFLFGVLGSAALFPAIYFALRRLDRLMLGPHRDLTFGVRP